MKRENERKIQRELKDNYKLAIITRGRKEEKRRKERERTKL